MFVFTYNNALGLLGCKTKLPEKCFWQLVNNDDINNVIYFIWDPYMEKKIQNWGIDGYLFVMICIIFKRKWRRNC